jgi:glycosyltransferase involved in cell wall biosynthesis
VWLMKKEIFILCPAPPEQLGGVEACVLEQVRGFEKLGYAVRVFHRKNSGPAFYRHHERRLSHHLTDTLVGFFIGREAQKAMHEGVAAVFSHATVGWYPLRVAPGCKQYHLYHGTYRGQAEAIRPFISYLGYLKLKWWDSMVLERLSGRRKQVFSVSELIRIEVKRLFGYESTSIGNPLDMSRFRPLDQLKCREEFGLPREGAIGLFVGNLQHAKGYPMARRVMASLPNVTWLSVVRGDAGNENGLADSIHVMQDVPRAKMPQLYSAADFSLCTSRYDAFPYAIIEALACGLPIISGLNGGSHQFLLQPPLDRLVVSDPDNFDGFVAAAKEFVSRPEFYRQAVLTQAKPAVEQWMNLDNWWKRFACITGL